jgi:hypothetical protein
MFIGSWRMWINFRAVLSEERLGRVLFIQEEHVSSIMEAGLLRLPPLLVSFPLRIMDHGISQ